MSLLKSLVEKGLATPPKWLPSNTHYLAVMGSTAYGVADSDSDWDCYGFCIPPKELVFPHLAGHIPLFDWPTDKEMWTEYQQHRVIDPSADRGKGREYDFTVFSIVKYFRLCAGNNPNMIDSLYVKEPQVLHSSPIGVMVRDKRDLFLSKECWPKFVGYARSQLHKMATKSPQEGSNRYEDIQKHGYDVKFGYHVVRLLLEAEQILMEGKLDLQRHRETLKEIRRGEWTETKVREFFDDRERQLQELYIKSDLRPTVDMVAVKQLLMDCLEQHYGNLGAAVSNPSVAWDTLDRITELVDYARSRR